MMLHILLKKTIEKYFSTIGVIVEKQTEIMDNDINLITNKDIDDYTHDIKQHQYQYYNNKHIHMHKIKTYDLLNKYIERIIHREIIKDNVDIYDILSKHIDDEYIKFLQINLIDDQIEILFTSIIYYQSNDRGIWNLFCRYGKTRLSSLFCHANNYKKILILVPSLYLVNQTYSTWKEFFNKSSIKKVCCIENNISIVNIEEFYLSNESCVFITTYHSSEKFSNLKFDICIYDESHRTAGTKLKENSEISFYKRQLLNTNFNKKLFLTATIKEYVGNNEDYYTMDDETIYGQIIASVSAKKAKELNRICNYKIITIELKPIHIDIQIDNFFALLNKKDQEYLQSIKQKYLMCAVGLIDTMTKYKIKHVITFHDLIINCKFFKTILDIVSRLRSKSIIYNIQTIDGTTPNRQTLIQDFQNKSYSILCSAKVLQEGVDIPKCDGVIFIDIKTSIIDTIQSLSRCLTIVENNPTKEAHIMIPFENTTDVLNDIYTNNLRMILRNIVEIDSNIKEFFDQIIDFDIEKLSLKQIQILEELKLKYNIDINSKIINELKEISYATYFVAKKLIALKYTHENDYKMNINNDSHAYIDRLPINANIIYKRFGWKSWNDYLGLENEMLLRKIKSIIQKENENRTKTSIQLIDTKETYIQFANDNLHLELPLDINIENGNWIKFCLKNYDKLIEDHYTIEQLKEKQILSCIDYDNKCINDTKFINRKYIENGFYNSIYFKLSDIYYVDNNNDEYFD